MILSKKLSILSIIKYTAILSLLYTLISCEVSFYEPLQEYVIAVENGKTLQVSVNNTVIPHDHDPVDYQYELLGEVSEPAVVSIENIGQINMTVNTIVLDTGGLGGNPFAIDISALTLPFTLQPDETAEFTVVFQPSVEGDHEAILESNIIIGSSDTEFGNFKLNLRGEGDNGQTLKISVNGAEIIDDADPVDFGYELIGEITTPRTITIENEGRVNLTIDSINLDLGILSGTPYAIDISGITLPHILEPGDAKSFAAVFQPSLVGDHENILNSNILITYTDPDSSTFKLNLTGHGTTELQPEIKVIRGSTDYTSDLTLYDFGNVLITEAAPPQREFQIKNTGTDDLSISGIVLNNTTDYSFSDTSTSATILPGESIFKTITFAPGSTGTKTADLSIYSDDSDENPFILKLSGTGVVPVITVTESGTPYNNNGTPFDFGFQKLNETSGLKTFSIENTGTHVLTVSTIVLSSGVTDYALTVPSIPFTLNPAESETFTLSFHPGTEEITPGTLTIGNSSPDDSSFILNLTGEGATGELTVLEGTTEYYDDGSHFFFEITAASSTRIKTITLRNDGDVNLVINSINNPSAPFTSDDPSGTILPGGSTTFDISFTPGSPGGFGDTLIINSDDVDETAFDLNLWGGTSVPFSIPGLKLWLDAQKITSSAPTEVFNDSGTLYVINWEDQSGNNKHAIADNTGEIEHLSEGGNSHERRIPYLIDEGGIQSVGFRDEDGIGVTTDQGDQAYYNGDILYIAGEVVPYTTDMTVFAVMKPLDFAPNPLRQYSTLMYGAAFPRLRVNYSGSSFYFQNYYFIQGGGSTDNMSLMSAENRHLLSYRLNTDSTVESLKQTSWLDNIEEADHLAISGAANRAYNVTIGNYYHSNFMTYGLHGNIYEILIFQNALTDAEIQTVHDYLNTKYTLW